MSEYTKLDDYRRELLSIIFCHQKIIVLSTLLISLLTLTIAYSWPKTYVAYGSLLVRGKKLGNQPDLLDRNPANIYPLSKEDIYSEAQIIMSHDVIRNTLKELDEKNIRPEQTENHIIFQLLNKLKNIHLFESSDGDESDDSFNVIYEIQESLEIEVVPMTNVIQIAFYHHNKNYAVMFLDELMAQYLRFRNKIFNPQIQKDIITQQLQKFHNELQIKENELLALVEKTQTANPEEEIESIISSKKELKQKLNDLKSEAIEKQKLKDQYDLITQKIVLIEGQIKELNQKTIDLKHQIIETESIQREKNLLQFSFETFFKRNKETEIEQSFDSSLYSLYVSLFSKAFPDKNAYFPPKKKVFIPIGILTGIFCGLSLAFIREFFNHTFKRPIDIERQLGLPVLFTIQKTEQVSHTKKS